MVSLLGEYLFPLNHHAPVRSRKGFLLVSFFLSLPSSQYSRPVIGFSATLSLSSQSSYQNLLPRLASVQTKEPKRPKLAIAAFRYGWLSPAAARATKAAPMKPQKNRDLFQNCSSSKFNALTHASYLSSSRSLAGPL